MLEALLAALDIHLRAAVTATAASTDTEGHHPLMLSVLAVSGCLDALGVMVQQAVDGDDDDVRDRVRLTVLLRQQQQSSPTVDHVSLWLPEALRLAVVLLTGRPHRVQPQTVAWLHRYGLRWDLLVMRSRGDYLQVTEFKQAVVTDLRARGFDLRLAFEDDPSNHAMYVAAGIPCVSIHSGYYE